MDWYDKKGKKLVTADYDKDPDAWTEQMNAVEGLLTDKEYKVVEQTSGTSKAGTSLLVSTVWLGLDHSFNGGEPLIFETMVFPEESWDELYVERYSSESQAKKGHTRAVKQFLEKIDEPTI